MALTGMNRLSIVPQLLWARRVCPLCTSIEFRTAESHALDRLLALFGMHPVRCVNCWRRYYWFATGATV